MLHKIFRLRCWVVLVMELRLRNIGGIRELELKIRRGVNLYTAPNSYGKTSLARAIVSLMTSKLQAEDLLNATSDEGYVEAKVDGKSYYRRIQRRGKRLIEEKKLIIDDKRAELLGFFSPENRLVSKLLAGEDDLSWFLAETSRVSEVLSKKNELEAELSRLKESHQDLLRRYKESSELMSRIRALEEELSRLEREEERVRLVGETTQAVSVAKSNRMNDLEARLKAKKAELEQAQKALSKIEDSLKSLESILDPAYKSSLETQLSQVGEELNNKNLKRAELEAQAKVLERALEEAKEMERRGVSTCFVCGSHVDTATWSVRIGAIESELRELNRSLQSAREELAKITERKSQLEGKLKEIDRASSEAESLRRRRMELSARVETLSGQIGEIERQRRELEERLNNLQVNVQSFTPSSRIDELRKELSNLQYQLQEVGVPGSVMEKMRELEEEMKSIESRLNELQAEYMRRMTSVRDEFTSTVRKVMTDMGFQLEAYIDDRQRLGVRRDGVELDIRKLSSSERLTLAMVLILAAARAYFSPPFFVVDESFMSYDQPRFRRALENLIGISEYVVVTRAEEKVNLEHIPREVEATP